MSRHQRSGVSHTQNFLHSPKLAERIVDLAGIRREDLVVEIGPGRGIITDALIRRSERVLAIEKDPRYAERLARRYAGCPRVAIIAADALDVPLPSTPYKVVASIPYDITTAIVAKLTSGVAPPVGASLVMQREAADRFRGHPTETLVSLGLKPWFEVQVLHTFRRGDFRPAPAVDSVLLHLERRACPLVPASLAERYRDMLAAVFSAWKPTVEAALAEFLTPAQLRPVQERFGEGLRARPSRMPAERWIELFMLLDGTGDDGPWLRFAEAHARLQRQQAGLRKDHRSRTSSRSIRGRPWLREPDQR